jgi:hypothetical protein
MLAAPAIIAMIIAFKLKSASSVIHWISLWV